MINHSPWRTSRGPRNFPVEGCLGRAVMQTTMQVHFFHLYVRDTVIILEEVNLPHPRCPRCDMLVPWCALNGRHLVTSKCAKGGERKSQQLEEEELWESTERAF